MAFYITTPIYYVNAEPHLGHAYATMLADAIARAHRLLGEDVLFLTGTDEHGQKVERAARKAGVEPIAFVDRVSGAFRALFRELNVSNDDFIRTTEARHRRSVEAIWRRVRDRGDLYKGPYEGWYCTVDEIFVPETQLVDGRRCPTCGSQVERLSEESYYFRLEKYQDALLQHYRGHPEFVRPDIRLNEVVAFVESGLQDLSVSRTSFKWGIPVPDDPAHVMYVWFDALTNYITAAGFGSDAASDRQRFARFWPADLHLIGKEILRQHAVYWPAFLMSADLPLPRQVFAHGWWTMSGAKMSKTLGNVVRPQGYAKVFGVDGLRYFVLREMALGQDASFTDEAVLTRYNADLANDLGNLVSRTGTMIERYRDGVIPAPGPVAPADDELRDVAGRVIQSTMAHARAFAFHRALADVWELVARTNKYIVEREPWKLARASNDRDALDGALYHTADAVRIIAALVEPVMPESAARIRAMLGIPSESWVELAPGTLKPGTRLGPIVPLFPRVEKTVEELQNMSDAQPGSPAPVQPAPAAPVDARLSIDDFMKVELRVARVLAAERVQGSRKLIKLNVDLGTEQRTVVAGIAEAYEPDALVGRSIVMVVNLRPAKLMGIESNGMILAASPDAGQPMLLAVDGAPAPGTRVR
jgi:methionyl-tRNA synthetase